MTFRDIKQGYQVFFLEKGENIKLKRASVVAVSQPRFPGMNVPFGQTQQLLVDVTIDIDGENKTYSIPENLETTYAGNNTVISTSQEGIIREVESIKNKASEALSMVDKNKNILSQCETLLVEWNPSFREKKMTEERFSTIEEKLVNMSDALKQLLEKLS